MIHSIGIRGFICFPTTGQRLSGPGLPKARAASLSLSYIFYSKPAFQRLRHKGLVNTVVGHYF